MKESFSGSVIEDGEGLNRSGAAPERAIVAGLSSSYPSSEEAEASLDELAELVEAAGGCCCRQVLQSREQAEAATFLGTGKLDEIAELAKLHECSLLVVDSELSGSQLRNIAERTGLKVLDRSLLILDIFARRAVSAEGKLQVELAQHQQRLSRLTGMGQMMSRLGGGIGTRGPGETRLESDRRHIRSRIASLKQKLRAVEKRRAAAGRRRAQEGTRVVAVVGYTNAGKSSLLNRLCGANLWEMDQVFATLDPAARRLLLPHGGQIVLIDTVGFIRRLPTSLIEAFKSTLEVVYSADLLLHISDAADPSAREKEAVVLRTLHELGAADIPSIHLMNKVDLLPDAQAPEFWFQGRAAAAYREVLPLSLKTGSGLPELTTALERWYESFDPRFELLIPYTEGALLAAIYRDGRVLERTEMEEGLKLSFTLPEDKSAPLKVFLAKKAD